MENLRIDLTQLQTTIQTYQTSITELRTASQNLDAAINILRNSDWKSGASTQYFAKYDDSWKQNMDRQLKILEHLKDCLDEAKTEYQGLYNQVHTLGQNI